MQRRVHEQRIDIKYHFIREFIVDGTVEIVFVTSENNDSDFFTKNMNKLTYEEPTNKIMIEKLFNGKSVEDMNMFSYG